MRLQTDRFFNCRFKIIRNFIIHWNKDGGCSLNFGISVCRLVETYSLNEIRINRTLEMFCNVIFMIRLVT